jgi:hypothetical protein
MLARERAHLQNPSARHHCLHQRRRNKSIVAFSRRCRDALSALDVGESSQEHGPSVVILTLGLMRGVLEFVGAGTPECAGRRADIRGVALATPDPKGPFENYCSRERSPLGRMV